MIRIFHKVYGYSRCNAIKLVPVDRLEEVALQSTFTLVTISIASQHCLHFQFTPEGDDTLLDVIKLVYKPSSASEMYTSAHLLWSEKVSLASARTSFKLHIYLKIQKAT